MCQLRSLRLEECTFENDGLTQILKTKTPKLESLALFSMDWPFTRSHLPSHFRDSLKDLWIEHCWSDWHQPNLSSLTSLCCLHLDSGWWYWWIARKLPPNLLSISYTVPKERSCGWRNHDQFEAALECLSQGLPKLKLIWVRANHRHPPFKNENEIRRKLQLCGVRLVTELVSQGKHMVVLPLFKLFLTG